MKEDDNCPIPDEILKDLNERAVKLTVMNHPITISFEANIETYNSEDLNVEGHFSDCQSYFDIDKQLEAKKTEAINKHSKALMALDREINNLAIQYNCDPIKDIWAYIIY